ncbi:hypothetical protein A3843_03570 [Pseudovibrio exalbescens]|uniref:Uncharacterized protein n=1 Tax=Pseudovibrio exalbescens TaxID=197461 RepID=A0A1U7JL43_9HYPH|nr:hypothetical protein A3843_03570 [Pseudovibrio exalbescens]
MLPEHLEFKETESIVSLVCDWRVMRPLSSATPTEVIPHLMRDPDGVRLVAKVEGYVLAIARACCAGSRICVSLFALLVRDDGGGEVGPVCLTWLIGGY